MLSPETLEISNPDYTTLNSVSLIILAIGLVLCFVSMTVVRKLHRRLPPYSPGVLRGGLVVFSASFLSILLIGTFVNIVFGDSKNVEAGLDLRRDLIQMVLIQGCVCTCAFAMIARIFGKQGLINSGLFFKKPWLVAGFSLASYFTFYPVYILCCIINHFVVQFEPQVIVKQILDNPELMTSPMVLLSAGLMIPIMEEIMFRGFLLSGLREYVPTIPAIIISAAFFGCMHELHAALPVFALGCILGYIKERTGSLLSSIIVHVLHNSAMLFFLPFI